MKLSSIGFIGGGRITKIILQALANKQIELSSVQVCDTNPEVLKALQQQFPKIQITDSGELASKHEIVVIALHPPVIMETLEQIKSLPTLNSGDWCDANGIGLERLYGTPLHQRGATLPHIGLRPTPREQLRCLKPDELGSPDFTIEGWLKQIEMP